MSSNFKSKIEQLPNCVKECPPCHFHCVQDAELGCVSPNCISTFTALPDPVPVCSTGCTKRCPADYVVHPGIPFSIPGKINIQNTLYIEMTFILFSSNHMVRNKLFDKFS